MKHLIKVFQQILIFQKSNEDWEDSVIGEYIPMQ